MRCFHPSQRCSSARQMTDNIFEVETTALAHVAFATQESAILLTDFATAYPSVNRSWIFHVLGRAELPEFICRLLRMIYCDSTTHVDFAGKPRGHFLMAGGVRQGCAASGFLFGMAFDPIFRWLQDAIIPRKTATPDFLQPAPCACADDFVVAASSFRRLMTALSLVFEVVDQTAGLNLNHRKCCWVHYGGESCPSLLDWVATNHEEFREMKTVKYDKYVGTMIGLLRATFTVGRLRGKIIQRTEKLMPPPRAWWRDCAILRSMPFLYWGILDLYPHWTMQPSKRRLMPCNAQLLLCWLRVRLWTRFA